MLYGKDEEDPAFIETLNRRVAEIESGKVKGITGDEAHFFVESTISQRDLSLVTSAPTSIFEFPERR